MSNRDKYILFVLFLVFSAVAKAQLFEDKELHPNTEIIKGKYYNGSGGSGYWDIRKIDSFGRVTEDNSYRKKELLSTKSYVYNSHNDKLYLISTFDINHPNRVDTFCRYQYWYTGNVISYQKSSFTKNDSTVIRLIENTNDNILVYQSKSFYFRPQANKTDIYEKKYTLVYDNKLLVRLEEFDFNDNSQKTTLYEYYPDGRLKRRIIKQKPEPKLNSMYIGGPGSDDMSYKYKSDKTGKITAQYNIVNGKAYKLATYKYYFTQK